jgi:hypothetical protein
MADNHLAQAQQLVDQLTPRLMCNQYVLTGPHHTSGESDEA